MKLLRLIIYPKSILVTILILFLSFSSPSNFEKLPNLNMFSHFDKIVHFMMYFMLAFMLLLESKNDKTNKFKPTILWLICIAFPVLLGGAIEIMQKYLFPPRTAELIDWFANIAGVLTAWIFMSKIYKSKSSSE